MDRMYLHHQLSFIISNIFDNDLASFKKLITYCIQDIQHNDNNIKKFKKMYKLVLKSSTQISSSRLSRLELE